jgi:pimeloyl-ACP methyl ester carboxylesterase
LDNEIIEHAVIARHSMGGYVALSFMERYSLKMKGLSLVHSTAFEDNEERKELRLKVIELIKNGGKVPFIKQVIPSLCADFFNTSHPEVIAAQIETGLKLEEKSIMAFYNAMRNRSNKTQVVKDAKSPVQWIIGKLDNAVPYQASMKQCYLNDVNFVSVYPDCGHSSMLEKPEKLTIDLIKFFKYCHND